MCSVGLLGSHYGTAQHCCSLDHFRLALHTNTLTEYKVCLLFLISHATSSCTTDARKASVWILISAGIAFSCVLIIIWWLSQEYLLTGMPSHSAAQKPRTEQSRAALAMIERTQNSNERKEMEWNRCAVVRREQHAYRGMHAQPHTTTHKAIYTCIDSGATQSSWLRANPSIAGWLGSNHHSQQGQNERMADSLRRSPLSHGRLMGQILGRFMRHPISRRTHHKKSLMSHGFNHPLCVECVSVVWHLCLPKIHFAKKVFLPFNHKKPISMCHESQFYLSPAYNINFLVFNAAKHSHFLKAMQERREQNRATVDMKSSFAST